MKFAIDFETAFGILQYVYDAACYYTTIEQRRQIPKFSDEVIEMKHHPRREWFRKYQKCEICGKRASFGVIGGRLIRCTTHKEDWMEDLVHPKCLGKNGIKCKSQPTFGIPGQTATHCKNCKSNNMEDVNNKKCLGKDGKKCGKQPHFGIPGQTATHCGKCKSEDMENVKDKKCLREGCKIQAQFGHLEESPQFCDEHKTPGMKNLKMMTNSRMCTFVDEKGNRCQSQRTFGHSNGKKERCGEHQETGMILFDNRKCQICGKNAKFGYLQDRQRIRCGKCKSPDMIDLTKSYCPCGTTATFNYPGNKPAFCSQCKQPWMIPNPTHRCEFKGCREIASLGIRKPAHCKLHPQAGEIDLSERICVRCKRLDVVNSDGLCINFCLATDQYYAQYRNKSQRLVKQNEIVSFLTANGYTPHLVDVVIDKTCNKYRPDIVYQFNGHAIVIEVDENQHARYIGRNCEYERMEALFRTFQRQLLFIRYNPDTFRVNHVIQRVEKKARQQKLLDTLKKYLFGFPFDFGSVYLFYDGWQRDGDNLTVFPFPDNCDEILRTWRIASS